ncbi:MAG: hypothetical protein R2744_00540 [Bacteroidales bacterium]
MTTAANLKKEYNHHIINSCEQLITLFDNFLDSALIDTELPGDNIAKHRINKILEKLAIELNSSIRKFDKEGVCWFTMTKLKMMNCL